MKLILKVVLFFFFFPIHIVISFLARHSQKSCKLSLYDELDGSSSSNNKNVLNWNDTEPLFDEFDDGSNFLIGESLDDEIELLERELDDENSDSINISQITQKKRSRWTLEDEAKWQAENQRETEYYEKHVLTREYFKEKGIVPIPWVSFFGTDEWDIPSQAIYEMIEEEKEGKLIIPENTIDRQRLRQSLEQQQTK